MKFYEKLIYKMQKASILILGFTLIFVFCIGEKKNRITQYGRVFYEMGLQCKDQCTLDKQLEYFKKAAYHDPNLADAYYQLALIYENKKYNIKSMEYFKKVADLDFENALAAYRMGRQYFNEGSYEKALRYFLLCQRQLDCPDDLEYYLARIYDQKREYMWATHYYRNIAIKHDEYAEEAYTRWIEIESQYNLEYGYSFSHEMRALRDMGRPELAELLEKIVKELNNP